jgi:hypothetical protein
VRPFTGSTAGLSQRLAGSPKRTLSPGSPPVREFHPPPKVTRSKLPQSYSPNKQSCCHLYDAEARPDESVKLLRGTECGVKDPAHLGRGIPLEHGGAGDEDLGAGLGHERRGLDGDATVHLDG